MASHRHYAITLALARHALYAIADLPKDHAQRSIVRHQVRRLRDQFLHDGLAVYVDDLDRLIEWFDAGAVPSGDVVVLSETSV